MFSRCESKLEFQANVAFHFNSDLQDRAILSYREDLIIPAFAR